MEIWKGEFMYDQGSYGHENIVKFELHVDIVVGSFEGIATDPEFEELCDLPIKVSGFINKDHISFVKIYPFLYEENADGKNVLDRTSPDHKVTYDGYYDPIVNKWTGDWETIEEVVKTDDGPDKEYFSVGTWELTIPSIKIP